MSPNAMQPGQELAEKWRNEFVRVLQAMGDCYPTTEVQLASPVRDGDVLWWNQPLALGPGAAIWIGTAEETWSALGLRILAAAGVESSGPAELKDTYLEVLRQSLGVLARVVSSECGRDIAATAGVEQEPAAGMAFGCQISISDGDQKLPGLGFYINQEMLDALQNSERSDTAPTNQAQSDVSEDDAAFSARACGTLDLLLDLEMPVSISFGRTQVQIQNVLKLITGSIIELNRSISEPVDVVVNNCTVARGEVVVVDGNYGVRISEVMSRKERLQESRKYLLPASGARH